MKELRCLIIVFLRLLLLSSAENGKRVLKIDAVCLSPYFNCDSQNGRHSGFEYELIEFLSDRLNMIPEYHFRNGSKQRTKLSNNSSDIIIGGLSQHGVDDADFEASRPYVWDSMTWCMRNPERIPNWKTLVFMSGQKLRIVMWISLGEILATMCLIYLQTGFEEHHFDVFKSALYFLVVMFGFVQETRKYTKKSITKVLVVILIIGLFFAMSVYNTFFVYTFLKPSFYDRNEKWADLIRWKYQLISSDEFTVSRESC